MGAGGELNVTVAVIGSLVYRSIWSYLKGRQESITQQHLLCH